MNKPDCLEYEEPMERVNTMGILERWKAEERERCHKRDLDFARYEKSRAEQRAEEALRVMDSIQREASARNDEALREAHMETIEVADELERAIRFIESKGLSEEFGGFEL